MSAVERPPVYRGLKGWMLWNGPVRFMFWRWRASEADRARLKQRVRELERAARESEDTTR